MHFKIKKNLHVKFHAGSRNSLKHTLKLYYGFMACSNALRQIIVQRWKLSCSSSVSATVTAGFKYHTDSVPYQHSAWTIFYQRKHSESHASVIQDDKATTSNLRQLQLKPEENVQILKPASSLGQRCWKPGDGGCFNDRQRGRMLKTGLRRRKLLLYSCFFLDLSELQGPVCIFSTILQKRLLQCRKKEEEKNHRDCERAWPLWTTSFNNRCQWKQVHKSINPWLLTGTQLKPLRWLPVIAASSTNRGKTHKRFTITAR